MSFRVDDEVLKPSGSELTRSSRIRFMRWVLDSEDFRGQPRPFYTSSDLGECGFA
jgi:hypothetical protein